METQELKFKILLESGNGSTRLINITEKISNGETLEELMRSIASKRYFMLENTLINIDRTGYKLLEIIHVK